MGIRRGGGSLDSKESVAYIATAKEQLADAEAAFDDGRHALCAFLSSSAAENAASSLLIGSGAKPSRKHRNSLVLVRVAKTFDKGRQRKKLGELATLLKSLEPHITRARYPIRRGLELLPPGSYYDAATAKEILSNSKKVFALVRAFREEEPV